MAFFINKSKISSIWFIAEPCAMFLDISIKCLLKTAKKYWLDWNKKETLWDHKVRLKIKKNQALCWLFSQCYRCQQHMCKDPHDPCQRCLLYVYGDHLFLHSEKIFLIIMWLKRLTKIHIWMERKQELKQFNLEISTADGLVTLYTLCRWLIQTHL